MRADWLEPVRRAATVFGGVWVGLWIARIVGWIADLEGVVLGVVALAFAAVGALAGWSSARDLQPMQSQERRDAVLGWGLVGALIGAVAVAALVGVFD